MNGKLWGSVFVWYTGKLFLIILISQTFGGVEDKLLPNVENGGGVLRKFCEPNVRH